MSERASDSREPISHGAQGNADRPPRHRAHQVRTDSLGGVSTGPEAKSNLDEIAMEGATDCSNGSLLPTQTASARNRATRPISPDRNCSRASLLRDIQLTARHEINALPCYWINEQASMARKQPSSVVGPHASPAQCPPTTSTAR